MSDVFAAAARAMLRDPALSIRAEYRERGEGPPVETRVVRIIDERGVNPMQTVRGRVETLNVLRADCPLLEKDDTFVLHDPADAAPTLVTVVSRNVDGSGSFFEALVRRS